MFLNSFIILAIKRNIKHLEDKSKKLDEELPYVATNHQWYKHKKNRIKDVIKKWKKALYDMEQLMKEDLI